MRLSHRLTLVFSASGLLVAAALQYSHLRAVRREACLRAESMAQVTAVAVRALVEHHARSGNFGALGRSLQDLVREAGITTVVVKDKKGRRLVGRSDDARVLSREPHPGLPIDGTLDGIYDVELPVSLPGRGRGAVQVGFHTLALEEDLRDIGTRTVRIGAMAFLGIALSAWLIGTWFGLRVEQVVPRIEGLLRSPEAFRPIRVSGDDELSRLAAAFNRLGASLKAETQRRLELELEKSELSAMLVHDLKTPLTVIRSGITLLQEQFAEEAGAGAKRKGSPAAAEGIPRRTFELLQMSTNRLHRMVEDVLLLARMEEVAGLRESLPVDVAAMVRATARDFELIAAERRQKLVSKLPKDPLPAVSGDQALLRRVLDNLLHNAVEHTPPGGSIVLAASSEDGAVRVSVSDSGPGIPPEARSQIFRKFFQRDLKPHVGNVGLGLALCEKAVHRHGGEIAVEDAKPRGACFYFRLPAAASERA